MAIDIVLTLSFYLARSSPPHTVATRSAKFQLAPVDTSNAGAVDLFKVASRQHHRAGGRGRDLPKRPVSLAGSPVGSLDDLDLDSDEELEFPGPSQSSPGQNYRQDPRRLPPPSRQQHRPSAFGPGEDEDGHGPAQSKKRPASDWSPETVKTVRRLRHDFGPILAHFPAPHRPARAVCYTQPDTLLRAHASRVLIGAWNPML